MAEEEKDDWLEDLDDDDGASELDQSDIESLLSEDDDDSGLKETITEEDAGEIDAADIDSLLSDSDDSDSEDDETLQAPAPEEADETAAAGEDDDEIDSSDIDALLSETDSENIETPVESPDQNEIDMLFSEVDNEDAPEADPFMAEEIDFKDVIDSDQSEDESFLDGTGTAFDADEFGIDDDIPDIPDLSGDESSEDATALFSDLDQDTEASDEATVLMGAEPAGGAGVSQKISVLLAKVPPPLLNRKVQCIAGGCLAILLLIGVFFFRGPGEEAPEPDVAEQTAQQPPAPEVAEKPAQPEKVNTAPVVKDAEFQLTDGTELAIALTAEDAEGDTLRYEILSFPLYGKLSGQAPGLLYIPGKDFSGQDSFMFRVSDGKNISQPANITISAPQPTVAQQSKAATAPAKTAQAKSTPAKPKRLAIAAKNENYRVESTDDVLIDWEDLWSSVNYLPFTKKVHVEIISSNLHGTLKRISNSQSLYVPDKYFGGKENIKYRFKLGKTASKVRKLNIAVKLGSPPPTIQLAKMAKTYAPGQTVFIDAQGSRDENRSSVKFSWQQISGVAVQLEFLNEEESQVAFVVPSSFNTVADPGPVLRLTATDNDGQKDMRDIKIATRSRRASAMWRGLAGGGIAEDPICPYENCPGGLLPWPYAE